MNEQEIFAEALERAADRRAAFLDEACGADPELRQRIDNLLKCHDQGGAFIDRPAGEILATAQLPPTAEEPGAVIGPYKLLEQIGEGGFGVVFMAEQSEPVRRKVALKVLKPGMDTRQVVARFEAERQALAILDHPNIAKVFDGGTTPSGRPYFVMDLVKGVPITDFCDQNQLTPRQRLELFLSVCQAVQHAHQKAIIHRDLKPTNVLVSRHDTAPVVKVIDFGVAKALGQELTDKTLFTGIAQMVGTPLYMSPEQAGMSDLDVDTRSDIYSLGVLLYELLTGTTPFDRNRFKKAAYDEIRRIIREEEPPKPSTRLSDSKDSLPSISAQRQTEPAKLTKLVRGELDWIVMKALDKDRNRRYETANGFAMDLQRYLADEPVLACPPSLGYRLRKFVRRNKGALAAAAVTLLFIVTIAGGFGWMARDREVRQTRLAAQVESILDEVERLEKEQKWPEALAVARRAEAVVSGGEADAEIVQRVQARLKDLDFIDRLEQIRLEEAMSGEGAILRFARADREYAKAFREYGVDVEALAVETSINRLQARPGLAIALGAALDDWALRARDSKRLAAVARGIDPEPFRDRLRATRGEPLTPEQREELRRLADSIDVRTQHPATLECLAIALRMRKLAESAVQFLQRAQRAHPGDFWLNFQLAKVLQDRNDYVGAVRFYTGAMSIRPNSAGVHINLGSALFEQRKLDEGIACFRQAIELDLKCTMAHHNLGVALYRQKKLDEAIACFRRAIELDPKFAWPHTVLGSALAHQQKLDEAIACHRTAIALDAKFGGAHNNLGIALKKKGQIDEAITCFRRAIELDPPQSVEPQTNLGGALAEQNKLDDAIVCFNRAIQLDPNYASAHAGLGLTLLKQKKLDAAIAAYRRAIDLSPNHVAAHGNLGNALEKQEKLDEAIACYRKAAELDPNNYAWHYNLGLTLVQQKKLDEAIVSYKRALELKPEFAPVHVDLGNALWRDQKPDEAIACFRRAIELDGTYAKAHHNLGLVLSTKGLLDEAIGCLRKATELEPNEPLTHFALGMALYNLGIALKNQEKLDEAITSFRTAIELGARDAKTYSYLGRALRAKGLLDEAIGCFRKATELAPNEPDHHFKLARALYDKQQLDDAIAAFRRAIELDPKHPNSATAHVYVGNFLAQQRKFDEAISNYRKAIELNPKDATAHYNLGLALYRQQKLDEAIASFRRTIELDARHANAHHQLGLVLKTTGLLDEAIESLRKAIELEPNKPLFHLELGKALHDKRQLDEAIALYRRVIELDPKHANAHNYVGNALNQQEKSREAIPFYRRAAELSPKTVVYQRNLANMLIKVGDHREGVKEFRRVVEMDATDAWSLNSLAWHLATAPDRELRSPKEAVEFARRSVELDPAPWHNWNTLSVACYRAGDWQEAFKAREEAIRRNDKGSAMCWNGLGMAMIRWRLGQKEEARTAYDRVAEEAKKYTWLRSFRQEAAELLGIAPATPNVENDKK